MMFKGRQWMLCAAAAAVMMSASPAGADVRTGIEAWRAGNYEAAVREWRPLADAGDRDAQFNMGQAYKLGRGVTMDLTQAQGWYERAARQGHTQAESALGLLLFQTDQRERAMPWIRRAAERGDPRAQYVLGTAHFNGDLAPQDWPRAYALMRRAADQGLPAARTSLTEMERHLSAADRERGLALAREMGAQTQVAAAGPPAPAATPPVRTPRIATNEPPIVRTPVPAPAPRTTAPMPPIRPGGPSPVAVRRVGPAPQAAPAPVRAAASGRWRVQLGAFSSQANAERQWRSVRTRVSGLSGLQPFLVRAGAITRLQAGPLASRGAADRICSAARSAGTDCFVVAP